MAAPSTKTVADPGGDVVYTPLEGYTPTGPPAWADLLGVTFTVSRGDHLTVTFQVADLPDLGTLGGGWSATGTVTLPGGRTKPLHAWVNSTGQDSAYVGSKRCGEGSSYSPATNVAVLEIDFTKCVDGRAVVRLYGEGAVAASKTAGKDTYYEPVYVDATASKNVRLR